MIKVVGEDGSEQGEGPERTGSSGQNGDGGTTEKTEAADSPDGWGGDATSGDRAVRLVLTVPGGVGCIIEHHAAAVDEAGGEEEPKQGRGGTEGAFGDDPGGKDIGPSGGEIGNAGELEQGAQHGTATWGLLDLDGLRRGRA